jgi:hypothetical protein
VLGGNQRTDQISSTKSDDKRGCQKQRRGFENHVVSLLARPACLRADTKRGAPVLFLDRSNKAVRFSFESCSPIAARLIDNTLSKGEVNARLLLPLGFHFFSVFGGLRFRDIVGRRYHICFTRLIPAQRKAGQAEEHENRSSNHQPIR